MAGDTSRNKSDEANHPVVSMLRELDESFISQANLDGFMNFLTLTSSFYDENSDLNTMTKFIKRYYFRYELWYICYQGRLRYLNNRNLKWAIHAEAVNM